MQRLEPRRIRSSLTMNFTRHRALLLLGPTGSGKTPLGQLIEARGLPGLKCVHFDFGDNLRQIVARNRPDEIVSAADIEFLRDVLGRGALLEDGQFPLAQRVFRSFLARRHVDPQTWVVLNGLPRHTGQALAIDAILDVRLVVCLECSDDAVLQRLAGNVGGDRGGRSDDSQDRVQERIEIFRQRTASLVEHYRSKGAKIMTLPVTAATTPEEMLSGCLRPSASAG
jgi:adenylate kinase